MKSVQVKKKLGFNFEGNCSPEDYTGCVRNYEQHTQPDGKAKILLINEHKLIDQESVMIMWAFPTKENQRSARQNRVQTAVRNFKDFQVSRGYRLELKQADWQQDGIKVQS
jgi:hypothetical protein